MDSEPGMWVYAGNSLRRVQIVRLNLLINYDNVFVYDRYFKLPKRFCLETGSTAS